MKSLIWKEWRENLKWAVLAVLLAGGFMYLALRDHPGTSVMDSGFVQITILFGALFGAILGFLQMFSEAHGDRRALLLHRPLNRSQIFLGKTIAGLALYLLALGIPFACAVGWVAAPGHIAAPFRWPMVLPGLADILTGVVYYFAGMLLAQREARWYGSRGLGLAAAVLCSLAVFGLPEFRQALAAILILGALLAVAAWGSFLTGGAYACQPRIAKTALAVTFLVGLLVVGTTAQLVMEAGFRSQVRYDYAVDRQGCMLVVRSEGGDMSVTDLAGDEPPELQGKLLDHHALQEIETPMSSLGSGPDIHWYRLYDRLFMPIPSRSAHAERWYYVVDEARLLGYDKQSKRLIGSFGPAGFVPGGQPAGERFPGALYYRRGYFVAGLASPDFLPFSGGVYTVDFTRRVIHPVFAPAPEQTILAAQRKENQRQKSPLTFVLTENAVRAVDDAGASVLAAPVAYDLRNYRLQAGRLDNPPRLVVWYEPSNGWEAEPLGAGHLAVLLLSNFAFQYLPAVWDVPERGSSYLVEYDAGGHEINRQTVPPLPVAGPARAQALYGLVAPLAGVILYVGAYHYYFTPEAGLSAGMQGGFVETFMALMLLSAVVCALVCFLLAHRYAFSRARRLGWALCGLLWGPAGLLLMLALQEWPARRVCPSCRKPRVVTRDTCEHCGALHVPPAPDRTEIFESSAAAPHAALAGR